MRMQLPMQTVQPHLLQLCMQLFNHVLSPQL